MHSQRFLKQFQQATQFISAKTKAARLLSALGLAAGICLMPNSAALEAQTVVQSSVGRAIAFSCRDSEATIRGRGATFVQVDRARIYIGYQQVSSTNKNPVMARFDSGRPTWCRTNYEVTNDDSTGYGLLWDGGGVMYAVFSSTGTQGEASQDFRRFATRGWLRNYGSGGGAKIAVLARVNPTTGSVSSASFLTAVASSGRTNSLHVRALSWTGTQLVVTADAWFSPRRANTQRMTCSGSSPFSYQLRFAPNLSTVGSASASRCS
ncbi:MAG: hypothetical protein HC879_01960 [Leptolyngbyaceae cyanobacterium SL_5_9]|nr:hypothetical protein [Leptolyngbyaceae cyanobacterium SL_5_9]NJO73868.1 hypothetical protein [Leptolyngbyaceae cyanobacterium RM1_406_9]